MSDALPLRFLTSLGLLLAIAFGGCGQGNGAVPGIGAEGDFERGRREYERGHHLRAIELLEGFERLHPGSRYVDDALFLLGKAHQGNREYILARQDFERLLRDFPRSPFAEDAYFEIANSWFLSMRGPSLDPEPAEEAVRNFRIYLRRYPEGKYRAEAEEGVREGLGLLAEKDYRNGRTYLRLGRSGPARRYFERSLTTWAQSPVSARALEGICATHEKENDREGAIAAYRRLLAHLEEDPARYEEGPELLLRARARIASLSAEGE